MENHAELFKAYTPPVYGAVCGNCEHYSELGCFNAAESLVQMGFPCAVVIVRQYMNAERCPDYVAIDGGSSGDIGHDERVDIAYDVKAGK